MALEIGAAVLRAAVPSLGKLLMYEWGLDKAVKNGLRNLEGELMSMHAFLGDVSGIPPDHLESQEKIRAGQVRKLSHAIETRLHSFMACMESIKTKATLVSAPSKLIINHQMDNYIKETLIEVKRLRHQHGTYPSKSALESTSTHREGTRMFAMDIRESNPVGLDGGIADLTKMLSKGDHVSIVGMGGMGKTTLARALYDKMKEDFDCAAFVPIGVRVDTKKILTNIFDELHKEIYGHEPDQRQLTNQLQDFLVDKRCLIVIDDLWDEVTWNLVEGIFKSSAGSKIITTTRNLKVAEEVGGVYQIEPLCHEDSKKLLCAKVGVESHDTEFDIVSDKILRKCGGVPIAIAMIGSLLSKSKSKEWHREYESIGFDEHKEDGAFEHVRKVLSYSYYALPAYDIKKCFLYLSLFPEDHWIEKNMLIWRWVAEGLVPDGSFGTGEKYFIELLDRCMIQWAVSPRDVGQGGCRVHSLMLDLIRDLSSGEKENFSTVLGMKQESPSQTIHRLAIHQGQDQNTSQELELQVGEVLSFYASTCTGSSFPALRKLKRVRVIDLEGCDLSSGDCKLMHLGKLDGLEYIGLVGTPVAELPKKIGRLKLIQTLDVRATGMKVLPVFVEDLKKLRCLRAGKGTRMMGRIGELTSLEELWLHSVDESPDFAMELQKLKKMRVLVIHFDGMDNGMQEVLVVSLHELKSLQALQVWSDADDKFRLDCWEGSVPSPQLRQLLLFGIILPRPMPWIHKSCVPKLSKLLLQVEMLRTEDFKILGQMPSLRSLYLHSEDNSLSYIAEEDEFPELGYINTNIELICGKGGLPKIQELEIGGIRVGMDVGLQGNMPLLERATYHLDCLNCGPVEVQKAEEELKRASQAHPNRPSITIRRWNNVRSCNLHRSSSYK
ncbi:putative inactive disease susceptibility protein LOV1 [Triticum dicoccoides]|uniref:putative inactive disease susceptibility protein LOV1 n=1 Tax=Triticum dicoccoides TaxID=85692 RepID=UPI00189014AD|nr:putative inactive disease susceptibility protein LOV1 [Triticum dicoccoides]